MSLKRAIQSLRSQEVESRPSDKPNMPSTSNSSQSMISCSFEDIHFSDEDEANLVGVSFPSEPPYVESGMMPLSATPTSSRRFQSQTEKVQCVTEHTRSTIRHLPGPPRLPSTPTVHSSRGTSHSSHLSTPLPPTVTAACTSLKKFPGPAGSLPLLPMGEIVNDVHVSSSVSPSPLTTPRRMRLSTVQSSAMGRGNDKDDFSSPPWTTMMRELELSDPSTQHLSKHTISYAKRLAMNQQLNGGKVRHLRVMVKSVSTNTKNISALVKDETGEMLATVHMKVWNEYREEWGPGCCMVLRQVSILSPTPRKHYLNITMDNIVRLYPPQPQSENSFAPPLRLNATMTDNLTSRITPLNPSTATTKQTRPFKSSFQGRSLRTEINNENSDTINMTHLSDSPMYPSYKSSSFDTRPSTVCSRPSSSFTGPSTICSKPSSSSVPSDFPTTDFIDGDFDAFFDGIDVSSLDV